MNLLFLASVIIPPIIVVFVFLKHKRLRNSFHPPGPPGLPFIGNLHQFETVNPQICLWKLSQKYGPLMFMKLGEVPLLVVSSAELAKEVLKTHDQARLLDQYKLSYNGLDVAFAPFNDNWRELRKLYVHHLLSNKQVQSFRPIREYEVFRLIENLSVMAGSGQVANLTETIFSFTGTLTCRIAFGKLFGDEGSEILRFDKLMIESQAMQGGLCVSDYLPLFGWVDKISEMISKLDKSVKELDEFYQELIDEHLDPNTPKSVHPNILDLLIQLKQDNNSYTFNLTRDHIKAALMDILVAGMDPGAATIIWAMTALVKNPNSLNKVQNEIRDLIGKRGEVNEDDLPKLSYLKAVIKESLRLYPPAPLLLPRETTQECMLEGYTIAPKTLVYLNAWAIARDPEYWENPEEFVPERFLNTSIDVIGQDSEVIPFGAGCPGISLGLLTVELALANLLYSFNWELPLGIKKEDIDLDVLPGLVMHKKNALCLVPKAYVYA